MRAVVEIDFEGPAPPPGAPIVVQVRNTSLQDAPATVLGEARAMVGAGSPMATIEVLWRDPARSPTAWAHVDVDRDGRVSRGDLVTTRAHPVPAVDRARVRVTVRRVE